MSSSLNSLPPEILISIFHNLPVRDGCQLSACCKQLYEIFQVELIWEKKILVDYGIDVKRSKEQSNEEKKSITAKKFYQSILYKYGNLIGTWQRKSLGHYGAIFQVCYDDWSLRIIEWHPPAPKSVESNLKFSDFMRISLDENDLVKEELLDTIAFKDQERDKVKDLIMVLPGNDRNDTMSIYVQLNEDSTDERYNDLLLNFINFQLDINLTNLHDLYDLGNAVQILYQYFEKFSARINCRNVYAFQRLAPDVLQNGAKLDEQPLPSGLFKGDYGGHGNEIIAVSYVESDGHSKLQGLKITGDPNVPMDKVTFSADLNKSIIMSAEAQRASSCDDLISGIEELSYQILNKQESPSSQPFIIPNDAESRSSLTNYRSCIHRFIGEAQIALPDYQEPSMIPAHIVIFDNDTLGVLFLELRSMSLYSRVKENLTACHFEDVQNNINET